MSLPALRYETMFEQLSGPQRTAILIVHLEADVAAALLEQLSFEEIAEIREYVDVVSTIDTSIITQVLNEFWRELSVTPPISIAELSLPETETTLSSRSFHLASAPATMEIQDEENTVNYNTLLSLSASAPAQVEVQSISYSPAIEDGLQASAPAFETIPKSTTYLSETSDSDTLITQHSSAVLRSPHNVARIPKFPLLEEYSPAEIAIAVQTLTPRQQSIVLLSTDQGTASTILSRIKPDQVVEICATMAQMTTLSSVERSIVCERLEELLQSPQPSLRSEQPRYENGLAFIANSHKQQHLKRQQFKKSSTEVCVKPPALGVIRPPSSPIVFREPISVPSPEALLMDLLMENASPISLTKPSACHSIPIANTFEPKAASVGTFSIKENESIIRPELSIPTPIFSRSMPDETQQLFATVEAILESLPDHKTSLQSIESNPLTNFELVSRRLEDKFLPLHPKPTAQMTDNAVSTSKPIFHQSNASQVKAMDDDVGRSSSKTVSPRPPRATTAKTKRQASLPTAKSTPSRRHPTKDPPSLSQSPPTPRAWMTGIPGILQIAWAAQ